MIALAMWLLIFCHPGWLLIESEAQRVSLRLGEADFDTTSSSYMLNSMETEGNRAPATSKVEPTNQRASVPIEFGLFGV